MLILINGRSASYRPGPWAIEPGRCFKGILGSGVAQSLREGPSALLLGG